MTALEPGSYRITTSTGSLYALELSPVESTLTRLPDEVAPTASYKGVRSTLRRDTETIRVLEVETLEVGQRGEFMLDLVEDGATVTFRSTSPVTAVDRIS